MAKILVDSDVLEQALEALELLQNAIYNIGGEHVTGLDYANYAADSAEKPITALRAAQAQQAEPVQEPVVWEDWWRNHGQHNYRAKPLTSERVRELMKLAFEVGQEAAPPQRPPLSDEEIAEATAGVLGLPHEIKVELARAVERKVRGE